MRNSAQPLKPMFNVVNPFLGMITVQLNKSMLRELHSFLEDELSYLKTQDDEEEDFLSYFGTVVDSMKAAMSLGQSSSSSISICSNKEVFAMILPECTKLDLIDVISESSDRNSGVDKIIWALRLGLEDPNGKAERPEARRRRPYKSR